MKKIVGICLLLLCTTVTSGGSLNGQTEGASESMSATDLRALSDQRSRLQSEIQENQRKLDELNMKVKQIEEAKANLDYWRGEGKKEKPAAAKDEIQGWTDTLNSYHEDVVKKDLDATSKILTEKQHSLSTVESNILSAINIEKPKQEFKKQLSWVFAGLVAAVIGGFYWIALRNAAVGSTIFAGDSGLQFITLFSLVIAIILFGLTDILQGRELAALLGGISGYILGRSSHGKDSSRSRREQAEAMESDHVASEVGEAHPGGGVAKVRA